jgi:hypothetical protein
MKKSTGHLTNSELLYLAAANRRNKYQGVRPIQQLSPRQRRQITSNQSRIGVKAKQEKETSVLKSTWNKVFGAKHDNA